MNIVFDIDGTLCFNGKDIHLLILEEISKLSSKFNIIFASARHPRDIARILPNDIKKSSILVGANGAVCEKNSEILYKKTIKNSTVERLVNILNKHKCSYLIDGVHGYYKSSIKHKFFKNITPYAQCTEQSIKKLYEVGILKILVLHSPVYDYDELIKDINKIEDINIHNHSDLSFDITICDIDKYNAIKSTLGIKNNFICFGNDLNDISLFKNSLYSLQVGKNVKLAFHAKETLLAYDGDYTKALVSAIKRVSKLKI